MANAISRIGMFQKKDEITLEEAQIHWHFKHGPIASKMNDLLRYDQSHTVYPLSLDMAQEQNDFWVDGYGKLFFDNKDTQKNNDPEVIRALQKDEAYLWKYEVLFPSEVMVTIPKDPDAASVKVMGFLKRDPSLSEEEFKEIWWGAHAELAKKIPGLIGYTQNWVYERVWIEPKEGYKRVSVTHDELPVDGIMEMYFQNTLTMEAAFASPEGRAMCEHAKTFIQSIGAQLVNEFRIFKA